MSACRPHDLRILLEPLHRTIAALLAEWGRGQADRNDVYDLYKDLGYIEEDSKELRTDCAALEFERFRLRPLLQRIHETLLREHLTLAKPALGWPEISCDPSGICFIGARGTQSLVRKACKLRQLKFLDIGKGFGDASNRWDRLRSARIAVFDLTARAVEPLAAVYHHLGASVALGQYPVVLALEGQRLPFNVDFQQVTIRGNQSDLDVVCMALDTAFFSHLRRSGRTSFEPTVEHLTLVLETPTPDEAVVLRELERLRKSRIEALGLMEYLVNGRKHEGWALLNPRWPGAYPMPNRPTCFHITPFADEFKSARKEVEQGCREAGLEYRKGDQGPLSDVMHSIWLLTCQAGGVVADLTGLNDNVCFEVGLALALGRPILLTARKRGNGAPQLYADIERFEVHFYEAPGELRKHVVKFLSTVV